jgi:hypothetical protein
MTNPDRKGYVKEIKEIHTIMGLDTHLIIFYNSNLFRGLIKYLVYMKNCIVSMLSIRLYISKCWP